MPHPGITNNKHAVLAMRSDTEGFNAGFDIVGPFDSLADAMTWTKTNITDGYDNPHWIVVPMTGVL